MAEVYPKINIVHEKELRYYPVGTSSKVRVVLYKDKNSEPEFVGGYEVVSLDPFYITASPASEEIYDNIDDLVISEDNSIVVNEPKVVRLYFKNPGTGIVKATYLYTDESGNRFTLVDELEFLCYEEFFKENYKYLWTDFEIENLKKNPQLKIMIETMMEYLDILFTYKFDIQYMNDSRYVKYKYLATLGKDLGFERIDFEDFDNAGEYVSSTLYREILSNVFDILAIRGTPLSYELLFNALGYDLTIKEFWWDDGNNLIEVDPYNDELSTFFAYDTKGIPLDTPQVPRKDPRAKASPNNLYNVNSKSNYIKIGITPKIESEYIPTLASFSQEKKMALRKYLEFLRPQHIQHLQQVLSGAISEVPEIAEFLSIIGETIHVQKNKALFGQNDNVAPTISNVIILSPTSLVIEMSEDVTKNSTEDALNVLIAKDSDGPGPSLYTNLVLVNIKRSNVSKNKIFITLPSSVASLPATYLAIVQNVYDLNGVKQLYNSYAFNLTSYSPPLDPGGSFDLLETKIIDYKTVRLTFNKALDAASVLDKTNFSFSPELDFSGATIDPNNQSVVYLDILNCIHNQEYTLTIDTLYSLYAEPFIGDTTFVGIGENINPETGLPLPPVQNYGSRIESEILFEPTDKLILSENKRLEEIIGYRRRFDSDWSYDTESRIISRDINALTPATIVTLNNNNKFSISFDEIGFIEITIPILLPATSVTYTSAAVLSSFLNTLIKNKLAITPIYTAYYTDNLQHSWVYDDGDKIVFQSANGDVTNRVDFIPSTIDETNILKVLDVPIGAPALESKPRRYDEFIFVNEGIDIVRTLQPPPGF